jgi:hypothetical protein
MIEIKKEYGKFKVILPSKEVLTFSNSDELLSAMESRLNEFDMETVEVVTYAFDEDTIIEATDLTMLAALLSWGRQLYVGDAIKLTIKAEYKPEDK